MLNRLRFKLIYVIPYILLLPSIFINTSCSRHIYEVAYPTLLDGQYDTEFPYKECADQLEQISQSIKQLNYIAYYKSYAFDEDQKIKIQQLDSAIDEKFYSDILYTNETVSGTATIIFYEDNNLALLTCAHVGNFPDTIVSYHEHETESANRSIQNIAVKIRDHYFVNGIPNVAELTPLAIDEERDIAVLGKKHVLDPYRQIRALQYPAGKSFDLDWGSFVYIFGYPMGHKMVTKGIVSNPDDDLSGSFIIDALFNRGFSGGIILAIKDGVPNFELVGMVKSVSADYKYHIVPAPVADDNKYDPYIPYIGQSYAKVHEEINYGITFTVAVEEIVEFINSNKSTFQSLGYDLQRIFD